MSWSGYYWTWAECERGSCQVIGRWQKSCCGVEERRTTKQISDKGGWIFGFLKVFRKVSQKL